MSTDLYLILHNIFVIISAIVFFGISLFVFLNNKKKLANILMSIALFFVALFFGSHVVGINISDPIISKWVLMLNLSVIFMAVFNLHAILVYLNKIEKLGWLMKLIYFSTITMSILFLLFSDLFLLPSVPKMYFINYYNPGPLNWVRIVLNYFVIIPYALYLLSLAFFQEKSLIKKKQLKYLIISLVAGYTLGFIPNFLIYDIKIDPFYGVFAFFLFGLPFLYGLIKYELFDVKVIAKKALVYSLAVGITGTVIALFNYFSRFIEIIYPNFPIWSIYLASSILIVTISVLIWQRLREDDILKYEFITTITHKFRTPLTAIKWATENISKNETSQKNKIYLDHIQKENGKLVALTNLLARIIRNEKDKYNYEIKANNISQIINDSLDVLAIEIQKKEMEIQKNFSETESAFFDKTRTEFVIQIILENAIKYSPAKNKIIISTQVSGKEIILSVQDFGMGIKKDELSRIFTRFYRGESARLMDTEGMGIGLSISKEIMEHQNGRIWIKSAGENLGTTTYLSLPRVM